MVSQVDLAPLLQALGVDFSNPALLRQALVHRSYLNEVAGARSESNERLEFLGDAVLGFVVADRLYRELPEASEGELTAIRSALVRTETLARAAERCDLGRYLVLGHGEELSGGRSRRQLLGSAFEAVIGAAYLDGGLEKAQQVIWYAIEELFEEIRRFGIPKDVKSRFQELIQARFGETPVYQHLAPEGPDHERRFTAQVLVQGRVVGTGTGTTKQEAERAAARSALATFVQPSAAEDSAPGPDARSSSA